MTERKDYYILRDWLCTSILPLLSEHGVWGAPDPAPLTSEEVGRAFLEVRDHKNYKHQKLFTHTTDGYLVVMTDGKIEITEALI